MANRFYQFDYAEMNGFEIRNMGILNIQSEKRISKELLKEYARQHLNAPDAEIVISNISRLTKEEFESLTKKNPS